MSTILPKMTPKGKERLRELIAGLRELPDQAFNFGVFREHNACGTVACAIGWTPEIFPDLVKVDMSMGYPRVVHIATGATSYWIARELFRIKHTHAEWLFNPFGQHKVSPLLPICGIYATPDDVAAMLEKYIELTEKTHSPEILAADSAKKKAGKKV
jgi:hypothetical protein